MTSSAFTRLFHAAPFDAYEDPRAAPGAYKGPSAADPWTLRRGRQNLLWAYLCGLVFLIFPAVAGVNDDGADRAASLDSRSHGRSRRR